MLKRFFFKCINVFISKLIINVFIIYEILNIHHMYDPRKKKSLLFSALVILFCSVNRCLVMRRNVTRRNLIKWKFQWIHISHDLFLSPILPPKLQNYPKSQSRRWVPILIRKLIWNSLKAKLNLKKILLFVLSYSFGWSHSRKIKLIYKDWEFPMKSY